MRRAVPVLLLVLALASPAAAQSGEDEARKRLVDKLNTMRVTLDFNAAPLDDVISYLRDFSGLNIHVDNEVRQKYSEDQLRVSIKVKDLLLKSALKLVLSGKELAATFKEGVLLVTTKDRVAAATVTRVYDVRDLLFKIQDFPGPKVELMDPSKGGSGLGASFTVEEEQPSAITEDFIVELLKTTTGERSWEEAGASISLANGLLIVTQSRKVHQEVGRLLDLLRRFK